MPIKGISYEQGVEPSACQAPFRLNFLRLQIIINAATRAVHSSMVPAFAR